MTWRSMGYIPSATKLVVLFLTASNQWITGVDNRSHYTIWSQEHNPTYETTDGSDYTLIDGEESTTCGGFNGMHSRYYEASGTYSFPTSTATIVLVAGGINSSASQLQ